MRIINILFVCITLLFGVTFACLNSQTVVINYYFNQKNLPLSLLLVFSFGIGLLLGLIVSVYSYLKVKSENRRLRNRANLAEKEIENLRAIPLKD